MVLLSDRLTLGLPILSAARVDDYGHIAHPLGPHSFVSEKASK